VPGPERTLRLVCFDLGGVVLRICRSWAEGCAAAGLDWREGFDLHRDRRVASLNELADDHQTGRIDGDVHARRFSDLLHGLYSPEEVTRVVDAWVLGQYPGMDDLVDRIHHAGLGTAVLSNTSHDHWETFERYRAFCRLRNRVGSHQLGVRKPDPAAYHAIEQLTGVAGPEIVFFDDLADNVAAARAVDWSAVQIDPAGDPAAQVRHALADLGLPL